jgi:thymidine phosphorylase
LVEGVEPFHQERLGEAEEAEEELPLGHQAWEEVAEEEGRLPNREITCRASEAEEGRLREVAQAKVGAAAEVVGAGRLPVSVPALEEEVEEVEVEAERRYR